MTPSYTSAHEELHYIDRAGWLRAAVLGANDGIVSVSSLIVGLYVTTQLVPTLREGDVVILDNPSSHKSQCAASALHAIGARFLFLPPYGPDLNPIEIIRALTRTDGVHALIFSKLKELLRKAAVRTCDQLCKAVGHVCDLFTDEECHNFFQAAGHRTDQTRHALARIMLDRIRDSRRLHSVIPSQ